MRIIIILYSTFGNISQLFYGDFRESPLSDLPDIAASGRYLKLRIGYSLAAALYRALLNHAHRLGG